MISRQLEIYENERYSPITGWSSKALLVTDRGAFSFKDGLVSWQTLSDVDRELISIGWKWEGNPWAIDLTSPNIDGDGWSYGASFDSTDSGVKNMLHFVRRRRFLRTQEFSASNVLEFHQTSIQSLNWEELLFTCDHCDLEEIERVQSLILDVITSCSLRRHPRSISTPKINIIKNAFITSSGLFAAPLKDYSTTSLHELLTPLANELQSAFSMASSTLSMGDSSQSHAKREADVSLQVPKVERIELAKLLIRKHDQHFNFHCRVKNCGNDCDFTPVTCQNPHCGVLVSRRWLEKHDSSCMHKIVNCERTCGECLPRHGMQAHLTHACALRPAKCPYHSVGCDPEGLTHRSLHEHVSSCSESHLLLACGRILELQGVVVSLNRKVSELEERLEQHKSTTLALTAGVAGTTAAIDAAEKRSLKQSLDEISKADSKHTRKETEISNELRAEVARLNRSIAQLTAQIPPPKK